MPGKIEDASLAEDEWKQRDPAEVRDPVDPVRVLHELSNGLRPKEGVQPSGDREPRLRELLIPLETFRCFARVFATTV